MKSELKPKVDIWWTGTRRMSQKAILKTVQMWRKTLSNHGVSQDEIARLDHEALQDAVNNISGKTHSYFVFDRYTFKFDVKVFNLQFK